MKKNILQEFCTPDHLDMSELDLHHNWHNDCYPFIKTTQGMVYGTEGSKHSDLNYLVIGKLCNCDPQQVSDVESEDYKYYPDGKEDWDEEEIKFFYYNEEDSQLLNFRIEYWGGNVDEGECYLEELEDQLYEAYNVYTSDAELIAQAIIEGNVEQSYNEYKYYVNAADLKGQLDPYFEIAGEQVDQETLDDILYYVEGDGKYEYTDYTSNYGRVWVNVGDNDESYISLWLNQRLDWDAEMESGKIYGPDSSNYYGEEMGTFDVGNANDDSWDYGNHVPTSLSKDTIQTCVEVFEHFGCDLENSFVAIGVTVLPILTLSKGEANIQMSQDDMKKMEDEEILHLLPPDKKHEALRGWMDAHNAIMYKKLAYRDHDGNIRTDKEPMTLAQYHSLIYQENKGQSNIIDEAKYMPPGEHYMHISQKDGWSRNNEGKKFHNLPEGLFDKAVKVLEQNGIDYTKYRCLLWKEKTPHLLRFDESEDFDTNSEPITGNFVWVNTEDNTIKQGFSNYVWHGKGDYWVNPDYKGFDVEKEKEWRKKYKDAIALDQESPNHFLKTPDGNGRKRWLAHLLHLGLYDDYCEHNNVDPIEHLEQYNKDLIPLYQKYKQDGVKPNINDFYKKAKKMKKTVKEGIEEKQLHGSAKTSLNQVAKTFNTIKNWKPNSRNLDIGGGKYDKATEYMKTLGVENLVFDPFNRDREWNKKVALAIQEGGADTVTVNNVLNVIQEDEVLENIILQAAHALKPEGIAYFLTYEGDKKGIGRITKQTKDDAVEWSWQRHQLTETYIPLIEKYFQNVTIKNKIIMATNPYENAQDSKWYLDGRVDDDSENNVMNVRFRPTTNESKKTKKIIKENMEQYNEFILEWKKWALKESEALQSGDLNNASEYHMLANEAYDRYSKDKKVENEFESKTFGELKSIFENNLSTLFKNKSNIIKEYTKLIKEDKNLLAQHYFFTALENFREDNDAKQYIDEAFNLVAKRIDYKTINESNKKVNQLLVKYRNVLDKEVNEDFVKLCENCNYVLTHKKKISNLNEMNNNFNAIVNYANTHAKPQLTEGINAEKLIEDYNTKFSSLLNEEEKSFVQEIMDAKKGSDNIKQKKLFEKFKGDCLNQINKMISESSDVEKEQLLNIKEQILNKEFCAETLVKDMAKLLEMRDVLMSE